MTCSHKPFYNLNIITLCSLCWNITDSRNNEVNTSTCQSWFMNIFQLVHEILDLSLYCQRLAYSCPSLSIKVYFIP